jgi:hypothetical protein
MAKAKKAVVNGDPKVDTALVELTDLIGTYDVYTTLKGGSQEVLYDLACAAFRIAASANRASIWRSGQALWGHIGAPGKRRKKPV